MSTYAKYADLHKTKNLASATATSHDLKKMTMDRNAYLTYLEAQLERVTAACLTTQGFGERIDQMAGQVTSVEERIVNLTRLLKLLQTSSESHDQDIQKIQADYKDLKAKIEIVDTQQKITAGNTDIKGINKVVFFSLSIPKYRKL